MTAPTRKRRTVESMDEALSLLRATGHRASKATRLVLDALFGADMPLSAEAIAAHLSYRPDCPDLASVYRNLERLEELGVVMHVHLSHGAGLYALANTGDREYLVCERCGDVTTLDPHELDLIRDEISRRYRFRARFDHFAIQGLCSRCLPAEKFSGA